MYPKLLWTRPLWVYNVLLCVRVSCKLCMHSAQRGSSVFYMLCLCGRRFLSFEKTFWHTIEWERESEGKNGKQWNVMLNEKREKCAWFLPNWRTTDFGHRRHRSAPVRECMHLRVNPTKDKITFINHRHEAIFGRHCNLFCFFVANIFAYDWLWSRVASILHVNWNVTYANGFLLNLLFLYLFFIIPVYYFSLAEYYNQKFTWRMWPNFRILMLIHSFEFLLLHFWLSVDKFINDIKQLFDVEKAKICFVNCNIISLPYTNMCCLSDKYMLHMWPLQIFWSTNN